MGCVDRRKGIRVDLRLDPADAAVGLDAADLLAKRGVDEPEQGRHRGPILEVRHVLDDGRRTVRPAQHHLEAPRGWLSEEQGHRFDVSRRRRGGAHPFQNSRESTMRLMIPGDACVEVSGRCEDAGLAEVPLGSSATAEGRTRGA